MKLTILVTALIILVGCGRKNHQTKKSRRKIPVLVNPRPLPVNNYRCTRSSGGGQHTFICIGNTERCVLNYGKWVNTYSCRLHTEEEEIENL